MKLFDNLKTIFLPNLPSKKPIDDSLPKYVAFDIRVIASAIDLAIIIFVTYSPILWILSKLFNPIDMQRIIAHNNMSNPQNSLEAFLLVKQILLELIKNPQFIMMFITQTLMQILVISAYTIPFWLKYSSTPGKMLLRIQIQDVNSGAKMTRKQVFIRFAGYILSFLPATIGFAWILFNKKHRGIHDILAGTVVVVKPKVKKQKS